MLALDPSGNYKEGKGITGWCLFDIETMRIIRVGTLEAKDYTEQYQYWDAHVDLIDSLAGFKPDVVIEDYLLYSNRAQNQINSRLETPQLLGIIKYENYKRSIYTHVQTAQSVKTRWSDPVLMRKGYIEKVGNSYKLKGYDKVLPTHIKDAIRHALHYATYNTNYKGGKR